MSYTVLLYYKYTNIADIQKFFDEHKKICENLDFKGRIIVANEGLNGTLEGLTEKVEEYCHWLQKQEGFAETHFKKSPGDGNSFKKMSIKIRPELVSGHFGIDPNKQTGKRLKPEELHQWFLEKKEFYIIDMRNDYEHQSGHFASSDSVTSILPNLRNFRDLPLALKDWEKLKDKTILTVCTGGVRCETASGFLQEHGFSDIWQLDGGIVSYMEKYPGENFLGKLYVFDQRMLMAFGEVESIGKCQFCQSPSENYVNVKDPNGRKHLICCENCVQKQKVSVE